MQTSSPTAPTTATVMYLIRHGATPANEAEPFILQGKGIDLPLSPAGERQALAVADALRDRPLAAVYASGMQRARQTAMAVAFPHGLAIQSIEPLHECDVGLWEGLDWVTIGRQYPTEQARFLENPAMHGHPEGESYTDVWRRVEPIFELLLRKHAGESFAVVAHNVVNRVFLASLMGIDLAVSSKLRQTNGGLSVIRRAGTETQVLCFNSVLHLDVLPRRT